MNIKQVIDIRFCMILASVAPTTLDNRRGIFPAKRENWR